MSSILADHARAPSYMSPNAGRGGGVSANEYSCAHEAQISFGDLTPYLTYDNAQEKTLSRYRYILESTLISRVATGKSKFLSSLFQNGKDTIRI